MAASWNGYSMERFVAETPHFKIYYHKGIEHLVKPVGDKFEELYVIYQKEYDFKLPGKSEIVLQDGDESNGLTFTNLNFIILWTHDFDFDMRGSHDWFNDVITHEFGHLASIWNALKYPPWMEGIQFGYFTHPNEPRRLDLFQELPCDILPPWFTEGTAQYESSQHGTDSWDTHRDMIMRSLTLSNKLLTWDHMQAFAGKGDDFEKTYNHGFSLVTYIAKKYGHDKIVAMYRKSSGLTRFNFDDIIRDVLGISREQLYNDWTASLRERYKRQRDSIGKPVAGRKINRDGYSNYWPRFSPDGKKIYFLSNGKQDYGFKRLVSYAMADSIKKDKKIKDEMGVGGFYDINAPTGRISFSSQKSPKSTLPPSKGGIPSMDLFTDAVPPDKEKFKLFPRKTERQLTFKQGIFSAAFSPRGDKLVTAQRIYDRFVLAMVDSSGKNFKRIYPNLDSESQVIHFIYTVAWSPDGKTIAFSYFDKDYRKIGLYDTATRAVTQLENGHCDQRDPCFSPDGGQLYFSSDESGVFNIYRYTFATRGIDRVTNVVGGAFAPAVSPDNGKLAYAGYDSSGYGIYLVDTVKAVSGKAGEAKFIDRAPLPRAAGPDLTAPNHRPYSKIPRQFLMRPTIIAEQINTQENNVYSGASALEAGVVVNLMDLYSWLGMGTELDAVLLLEPQKIFSFINPDDGGIDIGQSYEFDVSGSTQILPLTLSFDYSLRGIAGQDLFYDETQDTNLMARYNIGLQNFNFLVSHYMTGEGGGMGMGDDQSALHLLAGFDRYDVTLKEDVVGFPAEFYNVERSARAGFMGTFLGQARDSRSSISPRGIGCKFQYTINNLYSTKDDIFKSGVNPPVEDQYNYLYHDVTAHVMAGTKAPLFGDLYLDLRGEAIDIIKRDTVFPSFNLPLAWVPGYTYYFRAPKTVQNPNKKEGDTIQADTVLVTGNAVVNGCVSYRFPLSRPLIDKKIWIFYLEKLYGCLNMNYGVGVDRPSRLLEFNRSDWLLSYGAEVRLQATAFSEVPLAIKLRWDRGFDLPAPIGGDRFTLSIGFDFDDWDLIAMPDYRTRGMAQYR